MHNIKIAVISPKGGAGASTFSHLLGCIIKQKYNKKPLCVDLSYNKTLTNLQNSQSDEEKMYDVVDQLKDIDQQKYNFIIFDTQLNKRNMNILEKEKPNVVFLINKPTKLDVLATNDFISNYPNYSEDIYLIYNAFMGGRKSQKECLRLYNNHENNIIKNRMIYETIMNENISLFTDRSGKLSEYKPAIEELYQIFNAVFGEL